MTDLEQKLANDFNLKHAQGTIDDYISNAHDLLKDINLDHALSWQLGQILGHLNSARYHLSILPDLIKYANDRFNQD
jgi:hypothetical protein